METLKAKAGQPVSIVLTAYPGSGTTWQTPVNVPPHCSLEKTQGNVGGAIGGPVEQVFLVTCTMPGRYELSFDLKRAWEVDVRATRQYVIEVD